MSISGLEADVQCALTELNEFISNKTYHEICINVPRYVMMGLFLNGQKLLYTLQQKYELKAIKFLERKFLNSDDNDDDNDNDEVLHISCRKEVISDVQNEIDNLIQSYVEATVTLQVPNDAVPMLVGRKGASIHT